MNFVIDAIEEYSSLVVALENNEYRSKSKKLEFDMQHHESPPAKQFIEEALKLALKALPPHLRYVFFGRYDTLPMIIAANLNIEKLECSMA